MCSRVEAVPRALDGKHRFRTTVLLKKLNKKDEHKYTKISHVGSALALYATARTTNTPPRQRFSSYPGKSIWDAQKKGPIRWSWAFLQETFLFTWLKLESVDNPSWRFVRKIHTPPRRYRNRTTLRRCRGHIGRLGRASPVSGLDRMARRWVWRWRLGWPH